MAGHAVSLRGRYGVAVALVGLIALGISASAFAAPLIDTIVLKFREQSGPPNTVALPSEVDSSLRAALGGQYSIVGKNRDGSLRIALPVQMDIDLARAALNRIRENPAVLYANLSTRIPLVPKRYETGVRNARDARPVTRLIIKYRDTATTLAATSGQALDQSRLNRIEALSGTAVASERGTSRGEFLVRFIAPMSPARAAQAAELLEQDPDVEYADPDYWVYAALLPNDPYFVDTSSFGQWHLKAPSMEPGGANLPPAWDITTGSANIVVAVLDTGSMPGHPDLAGRYLAGYDMISDPVKANDGNGRDSDATDAGDWVAANECAAGEPAHDSSWHGTHVAGTIGANSNNGIGVSGINWISKLNPVRVLGKCGGTYSDLNDAITWAAGGSVIGAPINPNPARILNLSIGGVSGCLTSTQTAINGAIASGSVLVIAAGNDNDDSAISAPGNCFGAITVAATQRQGYKAQYSNYGPGIEISAPGGGYSTNGAAEYVWSTLNTGTTVPLGGSGYTYWYYWGTSMATPHVSGIASLMLSVNPSLTPAQVLSKIQSTARAFPLGGPTCDTTTIPRPPSTSWYSCQCTTAICGAGIIDAGAAVAAALPPVPPMPGTGNVFNNTYGALSVSGGTLNGSTISNLQPGAIIQLGGVPGNANSYIEIDFQGFNIAAGNTLTIRSGAVGQNVILWNADATASAIAGALRVQGGNGAQPPTLSFINQNGVTVAAGGAITAPAGLLVSGLGNSWTVGQPVINQGTIDGGPQLDVQGLKIGGAGQFRGNVTILSTITFANNPVNGAHFLSNGLQLYPSTGTNVSLTLHAYGPAPQVHNVMINGNGSAWMPSSWGNGSTAPSNNAVVPPGGSRPPGVPEPAFGGGSMIVQATGSLQVVSGPTNDFVFPGAIAFKAGGTLDLNGVVINQGWTITGKQFQGVFFESPNIVSPAGYIQVLTNNPNWINFSTFPQQHVRTWSLAPNVSGGASYIIADSFATHLNTYSVTIEAAANGQCWTCLINSAVVNMY